MRIDIVRLGVNELMMGLQVGDLMRVLVVEALVLTAIHSGMSHHLIVLVANCDLVELVEKVVVVAHEIVIGICVNDWLLLHLRIDLML